MGLFLRNVNFARFFSGQLLSTFGDNLFLISLMWFTISTTHSRTDLTWIVLAQTIPPIFGLFSGTFADHWGKKRTMIVTDMLRAVTCFGIFLVAQYSKSPFAWICLLVFILMLMGTFFWAAQNAILPFIVSQEEITAAAGLNQSGSTMAQLIGTLTGGGLLSMLGAPLLFLCNACSFVLSFMSLIFVKTIEQPAQVGKLSYWTQWREGVQFTLRNSYVLSVVISALVANFSLAPLDMAIVAWVKQWKHSGTALTVAFISTADIVGVLVGGLVVATLVKHLSSRALLALSNLCIALCVSMLGIFQDMYWSMFWVLLDGISVGVINASIVSELLRLVASDMTARVFGALTAFARLSSPLGVLIFGVILVHSSVPRALMVMAIPSVLIAALLSRFKGRG
jgi:MFS transporter, DHA3 family, macrolide efflux protein